MDQCITRMARDPQLVEVNVIASYILINVFGCSLVFIVCIVNCLDSFVDQYLLMYVDLYFFPICCLFIKPLQFSSISRVFLHQHIRIKKKSKAQNYTKTLLHVQTIGFKSGLGASLSLQQVIKAKYTQKLPTSTVALNFCLVSTQVLKVA